MRKVRLFAGFVGLVLALLFPAVASPQGTAVDSRWASALPSVDGQAEEWPPDMLSLQKKLKIDFAFKNDDRNLFILMVFKNSKSLSSIDATGITVFYGPAGSAGRESGVLFITKELTAEEFIALLENQGTPLTEKDKEVLRINSQHVVFEAYAVDRQGKTIPPPAARFDMDPPVFKAGKRDKLVIYEFRVPLAPAGLPPAGMGASSGEAVRVSFEWGGTSKKVLSARTSWSTPANMVSGGLYDENGETPAQQFLNAFDRMSNPSMGTKKHAFATVVKLAQGR
jgi:hypothetical protein